MIPATTLCFFKFDASIVSLGTRIVVVPVAEMKETILPINVFSFRSSIQKTTIEGESNVSVGYRFTFTVRTRLL